MHTSIVNMNWTRGTRELETATELTELESIAVRFELASTLQSKKQSDGNRAIGANIEADAFHQLIEFIDGNTSHNRLNWIAEANAQADDYADLKATQNLI